MNILKMNSEHKNLISPVNREKESLVLNSIFWNKLVKYDFEEEALKDFFQSLDGEDSKSYFQFGIDCISCFVQVNFTGPELPNFYGDFFNGSLFHTLNCTKLSSLGDSEDLNINTKYPLLLYTAKCVFKTCCQLNYAVNIWWQLRSLLIHQQVLDSLNPKLLLEVDELSNQVELLQLEEDIKAELELELAQLYILYRRISKADGHISIVRKLLQIEYELIGKMGKRTKFQQTELAQLSVSVKTRENLDPVTIPYEVPANVSLQDDVVLDNIDFTNKEEPVENLSVLDQKVLITALQLMLISQPQDNLYYEEVKPFIDLLLKQCNTWVIRVVILLIRCKFEAKHKRTIERCLMQCEEIVNAIKKESPAAFYRVYDVYSTNIPPIWKTQEQLGNLMLSLGLVKAALDIFLQLQNWEAVITCYTLLKLRHKAAEIIQQQLDVKPTVNLWCYLGDATDDVDCYRKAWELSNETSFRAQFHWGLFYYHRRQYEECICHLKKSVSINNLQATAWLYLGYAALETENWETAASAYRQYTALEPGSFETWNNLAKAYIRIGNKRGAHQALHDALRCNYDNWKVWDNLMGVSADIGHFSDIIRSYHRILEIKEKHLDVEVLDILVRGVCSEINDSDGNPANRLLAKTRELLGRITSIFPADGQVWELYSRIAPDQFIKTQRLQRALKGFMNPEWEKSPEKCLQVLNICKKLAESALNDNLEATNPILSSIKLNLKSVVSAIKRLDYNETRELVNEIDVFLTKLIKKIEIGQT